MFEERDSSEAFPVVRVVGWRGASRVRSEERNALCRRLSNALIHLADQTLLGPDPAMLHDPSALVSIARATFFLNSVEHIRKRDNFLLLGVIKHPVAQADFGTGRPAKRVMR